MSAPNNPQQQQAEASQVEQYRRHINRLADEIAQLSEMEMAPAEYYPEVLQRILMALQAPAGAVWTRSPQGNLVLQCQTGMREVGLDGSQQDRAMHDELLRQSVANAKPAIIPPHSSSAPTEGGGGTAAGNPTAYVTLMAPVTHDKEVVALFEVWQDPSRPAQAMNGFLNFMLRMAGFASAYTRNHRLRQISGQQQLWVQLEIYARQIHASLNPTEVAYWICNEGRRLVECDRISAGVREGKKVTVQAISGADVVEKRSNLVTLMRKLFEAVIEWGEKLVYTGIKDEALPPDVLEALDLYLAESNSHLLVVMPLQDERDKDTKKKARTALMMECFEPQPSPDQFMARLDVVAKHAGPALYNAVEYRRIPMRWIWLPLAKIQDGLGGKTKAITSAIVAGVTLLILALIFVPYPLKMEANGQLLPKNRVWVYAPWPGQILEVKQSLRSGTRVYRDMELLEMADPVQLGKMVRDLQTDIANEQARVSAPVSRNPDGTEDRNAGLEKQLAQITLAAKTEELIKLTRLYNASLKNPGHFSVRSPINGIVLSADFRENLVGRKVQPHEQLIRIGQVDQKNRRLSDWEIELKIPQKHIGQVLEVFEKSPPGIELEVDFLLVSAPTQVFKGKLRRDKVASQANPNKDSHDQPEPVVLAWVRIDGEGIPEGERLPPELLVTGTEVHSRIRCGNHAMGYSLFYGVWEFLYEKVVFFF